MFEVINRYIELKPTDNILQKYVPALVVHGPGNDEDSFGGIRDAAIREAKTPADGGAEGEYLLAFLDARSIIMMKEEAHSDLSRIEAQRNFIYDGNYNLSLLLIWTMYGNNYELSEEDFK